MPIPVTMGIRTVRSAMTEQRTQRADQACRDPGRREEGGHEQDEAREPAERARRDRREQEVYGVVADEPAAQGEQRQRDRYRHACETEAQEQPGEHVDVGRVRARVQVAVPDARVEHVQVHDAEHRAEPVTARRARAGSSTGASGRRRCSGRNGFIESLSSIANMVGLLPRLWVGEGERSGSPAIAAERAGIGGGSVADRHATGARRREVSLASSGVPARRRPTNRRA